MGLRLGCALRKGVVWGCARAQRGAAQGCSSVELSRGAGTWGCAGVLQRGAVQGCSSVGLRRGAAAWGCPKQPCRAVRWWGGLRRGAAASGCVGAQHAAIQGRSAGLRRGAARSSPGK